MWRLARLAAAGALVVFNGGKRRRRGTKTVMFLNVRGLLDMCAEAVRGRLEAVKRKFSKAKSECVRVRLTHNRTRQDKGEESGSEWAGPAQESAWEARQALNLLYQAAPSVFERRRREGLA